MSGRGGPGGNSRGRGGKFKKFTRGGGKHFSRDLRPLDADGNEINMWSAQSQRKNDDDDDDSDDSDEDSEEESEEESDDAGPSQKQELSREERKQQKAQQKAVAIAKKKKAAVKVGDMPTDSEEESDDDTPANPNHSKAARNMTKAPREDVEEVTESVKKLSTAGMSRRERESVEAAQAKERYRKLHEAGKTDEAKADLARLRLIKEKREAEAARRNAEKEEREAQENAKKAEIEAKEAKRREVALGKAPGKKGKK